MKISIINQKHNKMKRNLLYLLLAFPACASAYDAKVDGIFYDLDESGAIVTYETTNYDSYSGEVTVPSSIELEGKTYEVYAVGDHAFDSCKTLERVQLPETVTTLGSYAFFGCSGMKWVNVPCSVTLAGDYVFQGCKGTCCFDVDQKRGGYDLGKLFRTNNFTGLEFGENVETVSGSTFYYTEVHSVKFSASIREMKEGFWHVSDLEKVEFASVESACSILYGYDGVNPLKYAHHLYIDGKEVKDLVIPEGVKSISEYAFNGADITSLSIPSTLEEMGQMAFSSCSSLARVTVDAANPLYDSRNGCNAMVRTADNTLVMACPSTTIPEGIEAIGSYAFFAVKGLSKLEFPSSVKKLEDFALYCCTDLKEVVLNKGIELLGNYAFGVCPLSKINFPESLTNIGNYCFYATGFTDIVVPKTWKKIGANVFSNCLDLITATIEHGVSAIPQSMFYYCICMEEVSIPSSVTSIGIMAFDGCESLNELTIPSSVTSIGEMAFNSAENIYDYYIYATTPPEISARTFSYYGAQLHVVEGCGEAYQNDPYWGNFSIEEDLEASVEGIPADAKGNGTCFDLSGRRLDKKPTKGIYIQNGKKFLGK